MVPLVWACLLWLAVACCTTVPLPLSFEDVQGKTGKLAPNEWHDYYAVAPDDDSNIYFEVDAVTEYANAVGVYVFEERLLPEKDRTNPGAFLDYDESSMITSRGVRRYTVVIGQCYVQRGTTYYLSVRGGSVVGAYIANVQYSVRVKRIPARLSLNASFSGELCDSRYLHFYWELGATIARGGVKTTVHKTAGELDAFYMRYEKCAGPTPSNLAKVSIEGHGVPSGSVTLPLTQGENLDIGRYYVSVKGKQEQCGNFEISPRLLTMQELVSAAPRVGRLFAGDMTMLGLCTAFALSILAMRH